MLRYGIKTVVVIGKRGYVETGYLYPVGRKAHCLVSEYPTLIIPKEQVVRVTNTTCFQVVVIDPYK